MYKRYPVSKPAHAAARKRSTAPAHKRSKPLRKRIIALAGAVGMCACVFAAVVFGADMLSPAQADDGWYDSAAKAGAYEGKSEDDVRAELEKQVAEGMMNISIASNIRASSQTGEAEVRIENIAANPMDQKVTLSLADSGEVLYQSDAIAPGSHVQTASLPAGMEPGVYRVLATFVGYDRETHEQVGTSAAEITLTVEA